ncbi:MAG: sigma-70 family RNA polymerase sigma factor [Verrucomicrobiota bacterium]
MMYDMTMTATECSDAELVSRTLAGDRDAFNRIVSRYQILVCSLAYSRIGRLGQSEDVAQETFITAWKNLRFLREPEKLRAWLCGIVRNLVQKSLEREGREPAHDAAVLEAMHDSPSQEALPSEQAISHEEEAILWRSLEKIPELYREPLILFYREHQSIESVAAELGVSEDAVKQQLSRGRKLLQEEVHAFVESTLRRSAPGQAFSGAVLAALPAGSAATVGAGMAGKGTAVAKSGFLTGWLATLAPFLGMACGIFAHWLILRASPADRERRVKKITFSSFWIFVLAWCLPGQFAVKALGRHFHWSDHTFYAAMAGFWWLYIIIIATMVTVMFRRIQAIRRQKEEEAGMTQTVRTPLTLGTRVAVVAGLYLSCFSGLIYVAWKAHDLMSAGIMSGMMVLLGVWHFFQMRGRGGSAALRAGIGRIALMFGAVVVMFNWRWDLWLAAIRGSELAEIHSLLPAWVVPLLTLGVVIWIGVVSIITKPKTT